MRYISCLQISQLFTPVRNVSSCTAGITKIHRKTYSRTYPTLMVQPDGSSIRIRFHEPRQIITIPVDMSKLTEEERLKLAQARSPVKEVLLEKKEDSFDPKKYARYLKK